MHERELEVNWSDKSKSVTGGTSVTLGGGRSSGRPRPLGGCREERQIEGACD